ncbi:hydrogenase accessory protein HypB, partial [Elusimicrobiota bacterium]
NVLILSITEGEDKPAKYPLAFNKSSLLILNKMDIAEYLDLDMDELMKNVKNVNPGLHTIALSAKTGDGFDEWISWIKEKIASFAVVNE